MHRGVEIRFAGGGLYTMSDGIVTVIREPGAIHLLVSPSWRGGDCASDGAAKISVLPVPIKSIDTALRQIEFIDASRFRNIGL